MEKEGPLCLKIISFGKAIHYKFVDQLSFHLILCIFTQLAVCCDKTQQNNTKEDQEEIKQKQVRYFKTFKIAYTSKIQRPFDI